MAAFPEIHLPPSPPCAASTSLQDAVAAARFEDSLDLTCYEEDPEMFRRAMPLTESDWDRMSSESYKFQQKRRRTCTDAQYFPYYTYDSN